MEENSNSSNNTSEPDNLQATVHVLKIVSMVLHAISITLLIVTIISYVAIKNLRTSVSGKMMINITVVLLLHHMMLLVDTVSTYDEVNLLKYLPIVLHILYLTSFVYLATVLMLLFAAEAVNLFVKIVLVFSEIDHYVIKATITAWITPLFLSGFLYSLLYLFITTKITSMRDTTNLAIGIYLVQYTPMYLLQFFTWSVFVVIACVMCYRSCYNKERHNAPTRSELKKKLGVLVLLFTFLGLPWLFVVTVLSFGVEFTVIYVAFIIDALQGPALFMIRVVRLKEVRQFWRQLLCCCRQRSKTEIISSNTHSSQFAGSELR